MKVTMKAEATLPEANVEVLAQEALESASNLMMPVAQFAKQFGLSVLNAVARSLETIAKDQNYWKATPFSW